jgi:WD40 repeat protein
MAQENLDERQRNARRRYFFRLGGILSASLSVILLATSWYVSGGPDAILRDQDGPVYAIAFSPDGQLLASGGLDGVVRVWNLATLREQLRFPGHTGFVESVVFSPDGKTLVSTDTGDHDRSVRLWDIPSGRLMATVPKSKLPSWTRRTRPISPDGSLRVEADRQHHFKTLILFDANSGRKVAVVDGHPDQLNDWAFAPGGKILATGGGFTSHPWPINKAGDVRIWEVKTGRRLAKLDRFWGAVGDVEFSPDGKRLATASYDGKIRLWNLAKILGN